MKTFIVLAGTALALASCSEEQTVEEPVEVDAASAEIAAPDDAAMIPASGQEYADMASASDLFEIESSQLALERTQDAEIREFAQMLVTDHQNSTAALREAAQTADPAVTVNPALTPAQQADIDTLTAAGEAEFDQAYLDAQVRAHQLALAMLQGYAEQGDVESLTQHASETAGPVEQHLERARELQGGGA